MTWLITRVMTEIVTGMRHSLAAVPHAEELDAVVEGIVLGVLEKVMGLPSPDVVH